MGGPSLGYPTAMVVGGLPRDPLPSYNTHPPSFAESSFSMPQYNDGEAGYIEINGAYPPGTMPHASVGSPYSGSFSQPGATQLLGSPAATHDGWVPETYDMEE